LGRPHAYVAEPADRTGVATSALRYYDELGLVPSSRRVSGQRRYDDSAIERVGLVLLLREVGFSLAEIEALVGSRSRSLEGWRALARQRLDEIEQHIAQAQAARVALQHALRCPQQDILDCQISPKFWPRTAQARR
jgi:DNA-binding transcriptional MerR regulator